MSRTMKLFSLFAFASAASAAVLPRISVLPPAFAPISRRDAQDDYTQVFAGNAENTPDASIEGAAYQTFTVINSNFYDVDSCLTFCDGVDGCVFANLYYEYNTDPSGPLLKCAVYSDAYTAADKLNQGGQQLLPLPAGLTEIEQSSGWVLKAFAPDIPDGYELVFGPVDGANNAPGYMGFAALDSYDTQACADDCNTRGADAQGGACQFFNIWRAYTDGVVTGYTCSMYFEVADASTAVNYGQGDLKVTYSRGYRRISLLTDGGFEGYTACDDFCYDTSYANWIGTSTAGGTLDATIFYFASYAHTGNGVGLLGSATASDSNPGTLAPAQPLDTVAGNNYEIAFFLNTQFAGPALEASASVQVQWNGATVETVTAGYEGWTFYQVQVTAAGNDQLAFFGGGAPAWVFIDDINVFPL